MVMLVLSLVMQALANNLDGLGGNAKNDLHGQLMDRGLKASPRSCTDLEGVTLGKHGQGHGMAPTAPMAPAVPHVVHQNVAAQSVPRLPLLRSVSKAANDQSSSAETPRALGLTSGAGQLDRRMALAGLLGGVLSTSMHPCWAADQASILTLRAREQGYPDISRRLELMREQMGNIKMLLEAGQFRKAGLLSVLELASLREDLLVAEYLLRHEPQSISPMFDLASVFETRVNNLQNQNGSPLVTRPDEALSSLKELQNGIGNVLEALK